MSATVRIVPGANAWRILRTDRDGVSADEIPQMTAAVLRYWLTGAHEMTPELMPTGSREYRFGPVRPLQVASVTRREQRLPAGKTLANRMGVPGIVPSVTGKLPWYVMVYFWWRHPELTIPYPGLKKGLFGVSRELSGADYVLDEARAVTGMHDPGDATWLSAQGAAAAKAAKGATEDLAKVVDTGLGVGGLLLLYLLARELR